MSSSARSSCCILLAAIVLSPFSISACQTDSQANKAETNRYSKTETRVEMRDGVSLYTAIYQPIDKSQRWPILLQRTPYGCAPYGEQIPDSIMHNQRMVNDRYIFVYQDLRGRSMSDGGPHFENLKPPYSLADPAKTDEVTDANDTVEWLLKNVDNHNGNVGLYGHSYQGWTALMGGVSQHPSIKAIVSASPSIDIWFEDFTRYGMFTIAYMPILDWFGTPKTERHEGPWWKNNLDYWADGNRFGLAKDSYSFYLNKGPLSEFDSLVEKGNFFWKALKVHPDYDEYRQRRNTLQHLSRIQCPVLFIGGWHDEQNLYGPLKAFQTIDRHASSASCQLIMGPWTHGQYRRGETECRVGNIGFGEGGAAQTLRVEAEFFRMHLAPDTDQVKTPSPKLTLFDTGANRWRNLDQSPDTLRKHAFFRQVDDQLVLSETASDEKAGFEYVSDPSRPVPYVESDEFSLFPNSSVTTADQRFASKRPDVLTFVGPILDNDVCVFGPLAARLKFATSQSAADLIVKLIDVYPMDRQPEAGDSPGVKMNGYQRMVRFGNLRGRYRENYSVPKPFVPYEPAEVNVDLLDICHTFKKGHRMMIQIQSSMFPLFDRNPQKYVDNIFFATRADFVKATHTVFSESRIEYSVLKD